ncbi:MAG: VWA domain-containing protein [Bryobacteraceae bacterium]
MKQGPITGLAALLLTFGMGCAAQVLEPGQSPSGPPPAPGQLGPAPKKLPPADQATGGKNKQPSTIGDVIGSNDPIVGRATVRSVLVPTTVLDPDGHGYVNGIQANEFELYDNDRRQKISAEFTQLPMSVVLAVQANSDVEPVLSRLRKTGVLLQGLVTGEGGDVAIISFDHRIQVLQDFTSDPDKLDDAMQKLSAGSTSARLVDAVSEADHMLKRHDPQNARRHVILLLSRNVDKGSEAHLQETARQMQFDNVIIYCVDISKVLTAVMKKMDYPPPQTGRIPAEALPSTPAGARTETSVIQQQTGNWLNAVPPIAHSIHDVFRKSPSEAFTYFTGGLLYSFATEKALESAITDIGKDLNSQYLLSYSPSPDTKNESGFHTIKVTVNRPGLKIRTRPGYWWGGGQF